jgi:hypothetical protein
MRHKKEDVNSLLQRNADGQLADFDWEQLNAAITRRLDGAQRRTASVIGFGAVIRIAAGMAAAAAIILIAVTVMRREPVHTRDAGRPGGTASVEIAGLSDRPQVAVDIHTRNKQLVLCRLEIIQLDESPKQDQSDGAWIVVAGYVSRLADYRASRDMASMMCLF